MSVYVGRDARGQVNAFARDPHARARESIAEDDPELLAFLSDTPDLATARARAKARVDAAAEAARLAWITPGAGQALVYEAKRREAAECLRQEAAGDPPPAAGDYPFLDAEVGITKAAGGADTADPVEVARAIMAMADAWTGAGAAIERLRRGAKRAIETAATQAEIDAILAGLTWPTP